MPPLTFCPLCHWHDWWTLARLDPLKVVRCGGCGLVALHQQPSIEEIRAYYQEAYFNQEMGGYYRHYPAFLTGNSLPLPYALFFSRLQKLIQQAADRVRGRKLLDVGAGMGVFMDLAQRQGWQVKGVELSLFACSHAQAKFNLDMHCGELTTLDPSGDPFDWITMIDYLEHVPAPLAVLQKARELIAPQGRLFISLPRQDSLVDQLALFLSRITREKFQAPAKKIYKQEHFFYFTPETIKKTLDACGWEVIDVGREASLIPLIKAGMVEKGVLKIVFALAQLLKRENLMLIWARAK